MKVIIDEEALIDTVGPVKVGADNIVLLGENTAGKWIKVFVVEVEPDFEKDIAPQIANEIFDGLEPQEAENILKKIIEE